MKLGSNHISTIKLGSNQVQKVYLGSNLVWESFVGFLDLFPSATFAYSLRKLRAGYTGNCIKVRRSSDNATLDIGFVNNVLDTVSMLSFVGANDGFVDTWYDQGTSSNNLIQATLAAQPKIVSSGSVELEGGLPAVLFDGTNDFLENTSISISQPFSFLRVHKVLTSGGTSPFIGFSNVFFGASSVNNSRINAGLNFSDGGNVLTRSIKYNKFNGASSKGINNNGTVITGNAGTNNITSTFRAGRQYNSVFRNMNIQELILYPTDQDSNASNMFDNINDFYSIY